MLSDQEIEYGKANAKLFSEADRHHEHNDCIRIAYEWFDAQKKISGRISRRLALKHIIERWGGRYVSQSDVEVAAFLHPEISGSYPTYNISARLTLPAMTRLSEIGEAGTQPNYRDQLDRSVYSSIE